MNKRHDHIPTNRFPRYRFCAPTLLDAGEEREAITRSLAALYKRMKALAELIGERPVVVEGEICRDAHYVAMAE